MDSAFGRLTFLGLAAERAVFTPDEDGATFFETDTGDYYYYETIAGWVLIGGSGSGVSGSGAANTLTKWSGTHTLTNIANGTGYLYNNGAGVFSWSAPSTTHDILSATHTDSVVQAVSSGSLIYGNNTPKWDELTLVVPAAGICNYLGVNNGETIPSWKSASSNPGAAAAILASAPTTGYLQLTGLGIGTAAGAGSIITVADAGGIGNSSATARLQFDSSGATDYAYFSGCNVGINANPSILKLLVSTDGFAINSGLFASGVDTIGITSKSGATSLALAVASSSSAAYRGVVKGVRARGSFITLEAPIIDDYVFTFLGSIYDGSTTQGTAAIEFFVDGNVSSGVAPQRIQFLTSATNAASRTPRLTIKSSGEIGIGTVLPDRFLHAEASDAVTNAVTYALRLTHITSARPVAGFATGIEFELEENDYSNRISGYIINKWLDAGETVSASAQMDFAVMTGDAAAATVMSLSGSAMTLADAVNVVLNTTTGTRFGTATSQKLSFWNNSPIIQPTTAIAAGAFVANTSGIADDTATFGGYTLGQIVAALRLVGLLA